MATSVLLLSSTILLTDVHYHIHPTPHNDVYGEERERCLAGAVGLEPTWACAGGFGDRCNRRYATPLYKQNIDYSVFCCGGDCRI